MPRPLVSNTVDSLIRSLSSEDGAVRQDARAALTAIGQVAVPALTKLLESDNAQVRWEAAKALGEIRGLEAVRALVKVLDDSNRDVRWVAAAGLMGTGDQVLEPLLHELITRSGSVWVRESGIRIIESVINGRYRDILRPVLTALKSRAPIFEVPITAYEALNALRHQPDVNGRRKARVG